MQVRGDHLNNRSGGFKRCLQAIAIVGVCVSIFNGVLVWLWIPTVASPSQHAVYALMDLLPCAGMPRFNEAISLFQNLVFTEWP